MCPVLQQRAQGCTKDRTFTECVFENCKYVDFVLYFYYGNYKNVIMIKTCLDWFLTFSSCQKLLPEALTQLPATPKTFRGIFSIAIRGLWFHKLYDS